MKKKRPISEIQNTSLSLHSTVYAMALKIMADEGYNNFSAFIADLIRRRREELASKKANPEPPREDVRGGYLLNESKSTKP